MLQDGVLGVSLLAGGANVIMQLGRPEVGYGVLESRVDSGNLFKHPLKRTRTTVTYLAVAVLGTDADRAAYRRAVNSVHAHVVSTESSPVRYRAFDRELQLWVAACLAHGVEDVHRVFLGRPAPESWYAEAAVLGTTLQMRPEDFAAYWADGLAQVDIDDRLREYLTAIANLEFLPRPFSFLFGRFHRFVTIGFLPQVYRERMRLPCSAADQRRFDRLGGCVKENPSSQRLTGMSWWTRVDLWPNRMRCAKGFP
ncbi:oxygenase MpaB family protein [Amycolatopsis rubida]|uniref:Uncharacterized conserved protein, DUF2236 family n=1 Tax=Amycolatopsis rubida TaxID=112413 RepID=A0A1I5W7A8_9PSEU|nr:oxygenase MpaB family protein [Amycolatopsis rubida]SFQ15644.1 Uncharacterized conserved protein, DUF2236 family [Amycolatopsis rubida]